MYLNNQRAVQLSDSVGADRTQGLLLTHHSSFTRHASELPQSVMAMANWLLRMVCWSAIAKMNSRRSMQCSGIPISDGCIPLCISMADRHFRNQDINWWGTSVNSKYRPSWLFVLI